LGRRKFRQRRSPHGGHRLALVVVVALVVGLLVWLSGLQ
jgi:hypothetical protein